MTRARALSILWVLVLASLVSSQIALHHERRRSQRIAELAVAYMVDFYRCQAERATVAPSTAEQR